MTPYQFFLAEVFEHNIFYWGKTDINYEDILDWGDDGTLPKEWGIYDLMVPGKKEIKIYGQMNGVFEEREIYVNEKYYDELKHIMKLLKVRIY